MWNSIFTEKCWPSNRNLLCKWMIQIWHVLISQRIISFIFSPSNQYCVTLVRKLGKCFWASCVTCPRLFVNRFLSSPPYLLDFNLSCRGPCQKIALTSFTPYLECGLPMRRLEDHCGCYPLKKCPASCRSFRNGSKLLLMHAQGLYFCKPSLLKQALTLIMFLSLLLTWMSQRVPCGTIGFCK